MAYQRVDVQRTPGVDGGKAGSKEADRHRYTRVDLATHATNGNRVWGHIGTEQPKRIGSCPGRQVDVGPTVQVADHEIRVGQRVERFTHV